MHIEIEGTRPPPNCAPVTLHQDTVPHSHREYAWHPTASDHNGLAYRAPTRTVVSNTLFMGRQ
jgi:hypothetical protein